MKKKSSGIQVNGDSLYESQKAIGTPLLGPQKD